MIEFDGSPSHTLGGKHGRLCAARHFTESANEMPIAELAAVAQQQQSKSDGRVAKRGIKSFNELKKTLSTSHRSLVTVKFSQNSARIRTNMRFRQSTGLLLLSVLFLSFSRGKECGTKMCKATQKRLNCPGKDPCKHGPVFHLFIDISCIHA